MDCGTCFVKYVLCLFNFLFFIIGAALLALGLWLFFDKDSLFSLMKIADNAELQQIEDLSDPTMVTYVAYILMIAGAFIFILSLFGYCGALRESRCLLGLYGTLLILILILEIAAGTLAYIYKDRLDSDIRQVLKSTISNYTVTEVNSSNNLGTGSTLLWNTIMLDLSCCGVDNYTDFSESASFRQSDYKIPPYCCVIRNDTLLDPNCPSSPTQQNSYYLTGCYNTIMTLISSHLDIVIYSIVAIVLVELLASALAFCLCKNVETYDDK